jgi:flagellar basal-body rod protein FlgG
MAITALQSAASALSALNTQLDVTAHNLANINTYGFKSSRVNFQDLMYVEKAQPGTENVNGDKRPIGLYIGLGVRASGTQLDFTQGSPISTGRELDVAIQGNGFFKVKTQTALGGGEAFTRAGNFAINSDGQLVLASDQGRKVEPEIRIPEDATGISIDASGGVFITRPSITTPEKIGDMKLYVFINPQGLKQEGENLYSITGASGPAIEEVPGQNQAGTLTQKFIENSNVDPTSELVQMIRTQRAFEMNSNSIKAADDTLRNVAQLRRS